MTDDQEKKVCEALDVLNISYLRYEHNPVFTVEEIRNLDIQMSGAHCKNLFLRNRKGDQHFLAIVSDEKVVDLKGLSQRIDSTYLSLASSERLMKHLGVYSGAVGPFGLINDNQKHVHVLLDLDLLNHERINFHPNVNTATINMSIQDFRKYLELLGNPVSFLSFEFNKP